MAWLGLEVFVRVRKLPVPLLIAAILAVPAAGAAEPVHGPGSTWTTTVRDAAAATAVTTIAATTEAVPRGAGLAVGPLAVAGATRCWIGTWTAITKTLLGSTLFRWQHYVEWCGDGRKVTAVRSNAAYDLYAAFDVCYRGSIVFKNSGAAGSSSVNRGRQGTYQFPCEPYPGVPLVQTSRPRHLGTFRPDGTWSTVESALR